MNVRTLSVMCCVLFLGASALAQSGKGAADPVSGNWGPEGTTRLELKFDGKRAVSGTVTWRGRGQELRTPIKTGTFNVKNRMLISGGSSSMRDSGNVWKLFSTMCPSATVLAWCMASL